MVWYIPFAHIQQVTQEHPVMLKLPSKGLNTSIRFVLAVLFTALLLPAPAMAAAKTVIIETPLGNIELEMLEDDAPKTVANFLSYIEADRYQKTFIHRSVDDFIIQGGGFSFIDGSAADVPAFAAV